MLSLEKIGGRNQKRPLNMGMSDVDEKEKSVEIRVNLDH